VPADQDQVIIIVLQALGGGLVKGFAAGDM
jgi:hypothetical protein